MMYSVLSILSQVYVQHFCIVLRSVAQSDIALFFHTWILDLEVACGADHV